ncbi:MAG: YjbQ family protein, partial [Alphaproteobacteria bacterium]|nr:YjbQ family protein [Alphaproteobacteria bacterium]
MRQAQHQLEISTKGCGLTEVTRTIDAWVGRQQIATGLLTIFCRHTSASLLVQENADPDVLKDLEAYFARIAPEEPGRYIHDAEGPDDMPAHLRTARSCPESFAHLIRRRLRIVGPAADRVAACSCSTW